jgi:glycopeptide antibiotics resistance protein
MVQGLHITIKYWLMCIVPLWLLVRITVLLTKKKRNKPLLLKRECIINLFALYIFLFIGITLLPITIYWVKQQYSVAPYIVFVPFRDILDSIYQGVPIRLIAINLIGNIFLTVPFGVFLPVLCKKRIFSVKSIALLGLIISFSIEALQYTEGILCPSIYTRSSDVNDIILNTLGVLVGYLIYNILLTHVSTFEN